MNRPAIVFLIVLFIAGCQNPENAEPEKAPDSGAADFTGTWATDGTGAGGVRTFVQEGARLAGHFDEGRGRYDGNIEGRNLVGRFWWNEEASKDASFDRTPQEHRGSFEVTLSLDGNSFTGRSRFEKGAWSSWNGLRSDVPAGPDEELPTGDFTGTWATDGTGAAGIRTMIQEGNRLTGHFDDGQGRYDGVVQGSRLVGRFRWNKGATEAVPFDDTPAQQRGFFEVTLSRDGDAFTGRSKYEKGKWESWNGLRTRVASDMGVDLPIADFNGTWATDGTGAEGIRTLIQEEERLTGHFDEKRGRFSGVVKGWKLVGRFWWNEVTSKPSSFEDTPADQRGYFEVILSEDGGAFTGRSKFENGEWESWNGLKME